LQKITCTYEQNRGILTSFDANADAGSVPSSAATNGATFQQSDISQGAQNMREELSFEKLPEVKNILLTN
jgi:hypothetical protein